MSIIWRDAVVPGVLLVVGIAELALFSRAAVPAAGALEALAALALVFRRSHPVVVAPLASLAVSAIAYTGPRLADVATPIMFYVVAIYALGRYAGTRSGGLVGLGLLLALVFFDFYVLNPGDHDVTDAVFVLSLAIPPYVFGRVSRRLAEQTELVARQSEQLRDQAVREERDRIARELHDVVAHSLSAMVVQTAAAQDLVRRRPDEAAVLLESVAATGREALAETGRLLHVVRDDADELGLRPQPGLADVPVLVDRLREGGLQVDAELDLAGRTIPGGVDVSAYRVVQEALTNAVRHGAGRATLRVAAHGEELLIRCTNPVASRPTSGAGLGLLGMAERVRMLGGRVRHGTDDAGGFEVEALIPLGPGS